MLYPYTVRVIGAALKVNGMYATKACSARKCTLGNQNNPDTQVFQSILVMISTRGEC